MRYFATHQLLLSIGRNRLVSRNQPLPEERVKSMLGTANDKRECEFARIATNDVIGRQCEFARVSTNEQTLFKQG